MYKCALSNRINYQTLSFVLLLGMGLVLMVSSWTAPSLFVVGSPVEPAGSVILLPEVPVAYTDNGLRLLDTAAFVDENDHLQVPLRFIAEEMNAIVNYASSQIVITSNERTVVLELGKSIATVNGTPVALFRMQHDGSDIQRIIASVGDYYCDGSEIVYFRGWTEDWQPIWQRMTMPD